MVYTVLYYYNTVCLEDSLMTEKAQIMDGATLNRTVARISHEITERNHGVADLCILGVKRRGVPLARRICDYLHAFEGERVPLGELDITYQRDDLDDEGKRAAATGSEIPCDLTDKTVIIVDDVLYTGRTARASIDTVFRYGRPRSVQLVALVDRGHRELPIRPDYVGKNVPTSKSETVSVRFEELDGETGVYICEGD